MALGAEHLTAPQAQGLDVLAHIALSFCTLFFGAFVYFEYTNRVEPQRFTTNPYFHTTNYIIA
jgi:hypothetical protein